MSTPLHNDALARDTAAPEAEPSTLVGRDDLASPGLQAVHPVHPDHPDHPVHSQVGQRVTVWMLWVHPSKTRRGKAASAGQYPRWEFNHIEDGHSLEQTPADRFGRGWAMASWRRVHGVLVDCHPDSLFGAPLLVYEQDDLSKSEELSEG